MGLTDLFGCLQLGKNEILSHHLCAAQTRLDVLQEDPSWQELIPQIQVCRAETAMPALDLSRLCFLCTVRSTGFERISIRKRKKIVDENLQVDDWMRGSVLRRGI